MDGGTARNCLLLQIKAYICSGVLAGLKQIPVSAPFNMFWFSWENNFGF